MKLSQAESLTVGWLMTVDELVTIDRVVSHQHGTWTEWSESGWIYTEEMWKEEE
jgi:hypothetical protein